MDIKQMLNSNQGQKHISNQSYVQAVNTKWGKLVEGIQNPFVRGVTSVLLENQLNYLENLNEDTLSTGIASFTKYIFPVLRRVFPNLIANQIVSVQPMTSPVGGVFTYEYKYGDTKGGATKDTNLIQNFQRYYSSEKIDNEVKVASADVDGIKVAWSNVLNAIERHPFKWLPMRPYNDIGTVLYRVAINWISGGTQYTAIDDGAGNLLKTAVNYGAVDYATGEWNLTTVPGGETPDAGTAIWAEYFYNTEQADPHYQSPSVDPTLYAPNSLQVKKVPEVNIDIALTTIEAIGRKLKSRWSAEAMDDLRAFYGMDAETELVAGLSNEISLELDREIIDDLLLGSKFSTNWSYGPTFGIANTLNELQSIRSLLTMIDAVGARIHQESMRAPANFLVVPPAIGALLSQLTSHADFMMVNKVETPQQRPTYGLMQSNFGVARLGTLMNKYTVFQDPFIDNSKVLVGLKGNTFLDAGYVYAPYIPLQVTPTFLDPDDFKYRKGLRTRYAKKMLRNEYYGYVNVTGLPTVNVN